MTHCRKCANEAWKNGLCFTHFKLSQGYSFDAEQKLFVLDKPADESAKKE